MGGVLDQALGYAEAGLRVFPVWGLRSDRSCQCGAKACGSAGKHPHGRLAPRWREDASDDPQTIAAWWRQAPTANIGLVMGELVWALDIDGSRGEESLRRLLEEQEEDLPETAQARTGGGRHLFFAVDDAVHVANRGGVLPGIDVRGDGGYVVAPPSTHCSGKVYEWIVELERHRAAPPWLLQLVASPIEIVAPRATPAAIAPPPLRTVEPATVQRIRDALEHVPAECGRREWIEFVAMPLHDEFGGSDEGWQIFHEWSARGAGRTTPSGKPAYRGEADCWRQWRSFSTGRRNPRGLHSLWLYARKCGWKPPPELDLPPSNGNGHTEPFIPPGSGNGQADDDEPVWGVPEPLWQLGDPPQLDLHGAFPAELWWLRDLALEIGRLQQISPAFPALLSLGMAAGAAGKLFELRLDEMGWREPCALWIICALESGMGKSPVFRPLVKPFEEWEIEIAGRQAKTFSDHEADLDVARADVSRLQAQMRRPGRKADNPIQRDELRRQMKEARRKLAELEQRRPQSRSILASNLTTAALVEFLQRHHERALIVDPEGSIFHYVVGGRSDVDRDVDSWNKAFTGETIKQNRIGDRRSGPIERFVRAPCLSMALCSQTSALELFRDHYADEKGFLPRFICATFEYRLPELAVVRGELSSELVMRWRQAVHGLLEMPVPQEPAEILLGGTAGELVIDWYQRWLDEARLDPYSDQHNSVGYLTPVGAKLRSNALRLVLLLHVLLDPSTAAQRPIAVETVRAVIEHWMPFVRASIARSLLVIREDPARRVADRVLAFLWRTGVGSFSRGEAKQRLSSSRIARVDDLNPALSLLVDAGWIAPIGKPVFRGPGTVPAAARYLVHPDFRAHYEGP